MKNKSWQHPLPRLEDERFDTNKNGELDHSETFWRDMYISEMDAKEKARREQKENAPSGGSSSGMGCLTVIEVLCVLFIVLTMITKVL